MISYSKSFVAGLLVVSFFLAMPLFVHAEESETSIQLETPAEIKIKVSQFFAETPIMITVAQCESNFRQFTDAGNVMHNASGKYVGIFQIDESIHKNKALALGFDINTVDGNIGYAKYLYLKEGSRPWPNCSKKYVPAAVTASKSNSDETVVLVELGIGKCSTDMQITQTLRTGKRDISKQQVKLLQAHINRILKTQYNQAAGPTDGIFGPMTKQGVQRLQIALNETLKPEPKLVIDGIVGSYTRAAINNSCADEE